MARSKNTLRGVLRQWRFTPLLSEINVQLNSDIEMWGKFVEAVVKLSRAGRRLQAAIDCHGPRRGPKHHNAATRRECPDPLPSETNLQLTILLIF